MIHDKQADRLLEFLFSENGTISVILPSEDGKLWSVASPAYVDKELIYKAIKEHNATKPKSAV